jgi:DNA primase
VLFDLDPACVGFGKVAGAALLLREELETLWLVAVVHLPVGMASTSARWSRRVDAYEEVRRFCDVVAGACPRAAGRGKSTQADGGLGGGTPGAPG